MSAVKEIKQDGVAGVRWGRHVTAPATSLFDLVKWG